MDKQGFALAKAQMVGAIQASSGTEQKLFQHDLAILESIGRMWESLEVFGNMAEKDHEIIGQVFEMCKLLRQENAELKRRVAALEQRPVKKGLFG